jgi:hypothetical protein
LKWQIYTTFDYRYSSFFQFLSLFFPCFFSIDICKIFSVLYIKQRSSKRFVHPFRLPHRPCFHCIYNWNRKGTSLESQSKHLLRWLKPGLNKIFSLSNILLKYLNNNASCKSAYFLRNFSLVVYMRCENVYTDIQGVS